MADTDELPYDIRRSAKGLLWKLAAHWETTKASGQPFWSGEEVADMFAEALMAERKRCAQIADGWELIDRILPLADDSHNEAALTGQNEAAERIAAAIRQSQP